jgi:hypothetical protein
VDRPRLRRVAEQRGESARQQRLDALAQTLVGARAQARGDRAGPGRQAARQPVERLFPGRCRAALAHAARVPAVGQRQHGRGIALGQQQRDEHARRTVAALDARAGLGQVLPAQGQRPVREATEVAGETRRVVE